MKIRFKLNETIVHAPISITKMISFLEKRRKNLKGSINKFINNFVDLYRKSLTEHFGEVYEKDVEDFKESEFFEYLDKVSRWLETPFEMDLLNWAISGKYNRDESRRFFKYFFENLERYFKSFEDVTNHYGIDFILDGFFRNYKYDLANVGVDDEQFVFQSNAIVEEIDKFLELLSKWIRKMRELVNQLFSFSSQYVPEHENEEILYHTTMNGERIFKEGFLPEPPETQGLGGAVSIGNTSKRGISFTSNLYVAKEIAKCLKELILIVHREIKIRDIIAWSKKDGIYDDVVGGHKKSWNQGVEDSVENTFEMYKRYLAFNKERYDPLFFMADNTLKYAKTKKPSDVKILKCLVDISDKEKVSYLGTSMDEWRVLPSCVKEIIGMI